MNQVKKDQYFASKFSEYDVSVCIITYNKAPYINEAVDSVLRQQTKCKYEVVIGDNGSTDGTREILMEYWRAKPEVFSLIFNGENKELCGNQFNTIKTAKGKYIVILYGDDYWISDSKMQIEWDFLEQNCSFSGVTTAIESRYNGENKCIKVFPKKTMLNKNFTLKDFLRGNNFPMAGLMFRGKLFRDNLGHFEKMVRASKYIDDLSFCILILMLGDIYILGDVTAVYRIFRNTDEANNFNSVNTEYDICYKSLTLLTNMDNLTGNKLELDKRIADCLYSAHRLKVKGKITYEEFIACKELLNENYRTKADRLIIKRYIRRIVEKVKGE